MNPHLELSDYRRRVNDLYAAVRSDQADPERAWRRWRTRRDKLFEDHPQSALTAVQRRSFGGLSYFPYDPRFRMAVRVDEAVDHDVIEVPLDVDGMMRMLRVGQVELDLGGYPARLALYWILGYGGGLFVPFRDTTNGDETFGGGRYLLDAIKGADLGWEDDRLILDFNFAYNPSCAYSPQWQCPLPPAENWLGIPVRAGERRYPSPGESED